MGSLYVEIGQCGCQLGIHLNPKLVNSPYSQRTTPPHRLHAIMVDTEPKVLQPLIARPPRWMDPLNVRYFQYGRGNNWTYGYLDKLPPQLQSLTEEKSSLAARQFSHLQVSPVTLERYVSENRAISDFVLDRLRHQLETTDCAVSVNVLASLGGGTGSGIGTKMVERIVEEFSLDTFAHVVLPNKSGQTPLQVYNCLLSLASLQEHSSAIFTYENDKSMALFQEKAATLDDINAHLTTRMARFFRLNDLPQYPRFHNDIANSCVLSPQLKYLSLLGADTKTNGWEEITAQLGIQIRNWLSDPYAEQFHPKHASREKLLQGQLVLLGHGESKFQQLYGKKLKQQLNPLYADSLNIQQTKPHEEREGKEGKEGKLLQAVLVCNHSSIGQYLGYLQSSGIRKYEAGAYLWHYEHADLEGALQSVRQTQEQYNWTAHQQ